MSKDGYDVAAGWIVGFTFGFGIASFGWWNPYLSLFVTLASFVYLAVTVIALRERAAQEGDV
jgi:hypothetical protein